MECNELRLQARYIEASSADACSKLYASFLTFHINGSPFNTPVNVLR